MKIGAQFYTIRDFCTNLNDFAESLKKVADIGYKYVQISGTCEYDPQWLSEELKKNGLKCVITHGYPEKITDSAEAAIKAHDILECNNIGLGMFKFDEEKEDYAYNDFLKKYTPIIDMISAGGKYFMYHNHAREFQKLNGKPIIELLSEVFSKEQMGFTLDTYWVQVGGGDPAYWIERLSERVPCIHVKDCAYGQQMAVIGEGNLNFKRIFEKAESSGTQYLIVEQDECYGEDPFECLKRSYNNLRAFGFK